MKNSQLTYLIGQLWVLTALIVLCLGEKTLGTWLSYFVIFVVGVTNIIKSTLQERNED